MRNQISRSRGTMGVREMPDRNDSGYCHVNDGQHAPSDTAVVRVNVDGVWTSLCPAHRDALVEFLAAPLPAPDPFPEGAMVQVIDHDRRTLLGPFRVARSYWPTPTCELIDPLDRQRGMVRQNHDRMVTR